MRYVILATGVLLPPVAVWLRAIKKITVNFAAFWGLTGILLAVVGIFSPLSGRIEALDAGRKRYLCLFGGFLLSGGLFVSHIFSRLTVKNQELAIRLSLLRHEKEQILAGLDERNEEDSFCNQYDGSGGRGDGLSGIFEENR